MITCKPNERKIDEKKKKIHHQSLPHLFRLSGSSHISISPVLPPVPGICPGPLSICSIHPSGLLFLPSFPHSPTLKNVSGFPSFQLGLDPPPLKKMKRR